MTPFRCPSEQVILGERYTFCFAPQSGNRCVSSICRPAQTETNCFVFGHKRPFQSQRLRPPLRPIFFSRWPPKSESALASPLTIAACKLGTSRLFLPTSEQRYRPHFLTRPLRRLGRPCLHSGPRNRFHWRGFGRYAPRHWFT